MSRCRLIAVLVLSLVTSRHRASADPPQQQAWQTCSLTEGKDDSCGPGDRPRRFQEFLVPGAWANTPGDSFSSDFQWDLNQPETRQFTVKWHEVGRLGIHRIRT